MPLNNKQIDWTLSGATSQGQSGPRSEGNEGVFCIPPISSFARALDCLVSYPEHSLGESYSTVEMQSVNSTAPADWAKNLCDKLAAS